MKEYLREYYLFMKITPKFTGDRPLIDIVYNYSSSEVLGFIATEGGGSNEPGDPIYIVSLTTFLMFLFAPLFVFIF